MNINASKVLRPKTPTSETDEGVLSHRSKALPSHYLSRKPRTRNDDTNSKTMQCVYRTPIALRTWLTTTSSHRLASMLAQCSSCSSHWVGHKLSTISNHHHHLVRRLSDWQQLTAAEINCVVVRISLAANAWVFLRNSGGLLNPAVTFGMCLISALPWVTGVCSS